MPFTGKSSVLNDIHIYQLGCQSILCVNTVVEYHLKPNSSDSWASHLVFLTKVLYIFFPYPKAVHVTTATIVFFTHKGCLCVETHVKGNSWDHMCTKWCVFLILWGSLCSLPCWYLKAILILWHLVTNRNWFKVQLMASSELGSSGADTNKGLLLFKYSVVICLLGWNPQQLGGWHQVGWNSWSAS